MVLEPNVIFLFCIFRDSYSGIVSLYDGGIDEFRSQKHQEANISASALQRYHYIVTITSLTLIFCETGRYDVRLFADG